MCIPSVCASTSAIPSTSCTFSTFACMFVSTCAHHVHVLKVHHVLAIADALAMTSVYEHKTATNHCNTRLQQTLHLLHQDARQCTMCTSCHPILLWGGFE
mmetsp:Transcript_55114/g.89316  ORF Transcript_55114/g.89316 Transcript_55114/m.89316 type:complete len:100 (+) Transcript_55114:110-409(+)